MRATVFVAGMTAINLVAMGVVVSGAALPAPVPGVLRAQGLELVDARGTVRGSFRSEDNGDAVFRIMSGKGEIRVKIGGSDTGSGIVLMNDDTAPGVQMLAKGAGSSIKVADPGKPARVMAP
jgi:hypothetical protein